MNFLYLYFSCHSMIIDLICNCDYICTRYHTPQIQLYKKVTRFIESMVIVATSMVYFGSTILFRKIPDNPMTPSDSPSPPWLETLNKNSN